MSDEDDETGMPEDRQGALDHFNARFGVPSTVPGNFARVIERSVLWATRPLAGLADPTGCHWVPLGPRNVGGRIQSLAQDPNVPTTIYAGSADGGLWRTMDAGDRWEALGTAAERFPVGAVAVAPNNPRQLYIGTGDRVAGYLGGRGVFSVVIQPNNTAVFTQLVGAPGTAAAGSGSANHYTDVVVDPNNPNRFWIGADSGVWRWEPSLGGANKFLPDTPPPPPSGAGNYCTSLVLTIDPGNANQYILYAGITGNGVYWATFIPATQTLSAWTQSSGLPTANFTLVRVALCRDQPAFVYAVMSVSNASGTSTTATKLYRSEDGGRTFSARGDWPDTSDTAWYSLMLGVHPQQPNLLIGSVVDGYRSFDGGNHWDENKIMDWMRDNAGDHAQHGDHHAVLFDRGDRNRVWIGHDGGVSVSDDVFRSTPPHWRKRSHGISAGQFNDIAVNATLPFMMGGGLQDNGTFLGYGKTWYRVGWGDGGYCAFEPGNPRQYVFSWQYSPGVAANVSVLPPPGADGSDRATGVANPAPDLGPAIPPRMWNTQLTGAVLPAGFAGGFTPVVARHPNPAQANHMLVALFSAAPPPGPPLPPPRVAAVYLLTGYLAPPLTFTALTLPTVAAVPGLANAECSAIEYSRSAPNWNTDWWFGFSNGTVLLSTNAGAAGSFVVRTPPWTNTGWVNAIAVHPANFRLVAVASSFTAGEVFVTGDQGATWRPINGAGASALPLSPITALAWDPTNQAVLFAGTAAGVYVARNVATNPPPPPPVVPAPPAVIWQTFNANLPLVMTTQLAVTSVPATAGAAGGTPEATARNRLRLSTYAHGVFECDLTAAGTPQFRTFIRSLLYEDGLGYPRPALGALPLTDDPRFPAAPAAGSVLLDHAHAFDIRVDAPDFLFFDEQVDSVEFDENMATETGVPGELNVVYVQVHNGGWDDIPTADIHLYAAPQAPVALGAAIPAALSLEAGFFAGAALDPPAGSAWQRVGVKQTIAQFRPGEPRVVRFEWVPTPAMATAGGAALLAMVTTPAANDPFVVPAPGPTAVAALVQSDRHVALRVAPVSAYTPDVYIRDGSDDDGNLGAVAFGGRSPDIIVVHAQPATPRDAFADLFVQREADVLKSTGDNFIYVRVSNRKRVPQAALVSLFAVKSTDPPFDNTKWITINPVTPSAPGATTVACTPGPLDWALALFTWPSPPDPDPAPTDPFRAYTLIALVQSADNTDPLPARAGVTTLAQLWTLSRDAANANNAAVRAIRYEKAP